MGSQKKSLEFFISYSHKDMTIKEKLLETLAPVKKKYNVIDENSFNTCCVL